MTDQERNATATNAPPPQSGVRVGSACGGEPSFDAMHKAASITYWQGSIRLASHVGTCLEASALPQDEVTAAVVLAVILARHFTMAPGWYQARVERADGHTVVVDEGDERVVMARELLGGTVRGRGMNATSLRTLRAAVLAGTASSEKSRPIVPVDASARPIIGPEAASALDLESCVVIGS